jgi:hypothetical protein
MRSGSSGSFQSGPRIFQGVSRLGLRRYVARLVICLAVIIAANGVPTLAMAAHVPARVLVYVGNHAIDEGYTKFGRAARATVVTRAVLPATLSRYRCVVLPINQVRFRARQKAIFAAYLVGGGRILALAEFREFSAAAVKTMNNLASSLGTGLRLTPANVALGFHTTHRINPSAFTRQVRAIRFAATSLVRVVVHGHARSLVQTSNGKTFIGVDRMGHGVFMLSGDSNVFSDFSGTGYSRQDNGVLVRNFCAFPPS